MRLLTAVLAVTLLTGCWDLEEIEDRAFVLALGFDRTVDGRVEATVQVPRPQALTFARGQAPTSPKDQVVIVSATGATAWEALAEVDKRTSRRLFLGDIQVLVIGDDLARSGPGGAFDALFRRVEANRHARVLLAANAKEVVSAPTVGQLLPAFYYPTFFQSASNMEESRDANFWRVWLELAQPNAATFLPRVRLEGERPVMEGFGLLAERRLTGMVDSTQARGVNWVASNLHAGAVSLRLDNDTLALRLLGSKPRVTAAWWDHGQAHLDVSIDVRTELAEDDSMTTSITPERRSRIEQALAALVKEEATAGLAAAQKAGADIFNFHEFMRIADPAAWDPEAWKEQFPTADVHIEVEPHVSAKTPVR